VLGRWVSDLGQEVEIEAMVPTFSGEQGIDLCMVDEPREMSAASAEYWLG
jgi:hypothetical protein